MASPVPCFGFPRARSQVSTIVPDILVPTLQSSQGRQQEGKQQEQKRPSLSASQEAEDPEFRSPIAWVSLYHHTPGQFLAL